LFPGFCELIPNQLLRPFDERELELVICGISNIDVNDWKQYTRLKHCTPETPQVIWFWQVILKLRLLISWYKLTSLSPNIPQIFKNV
jgi:hypothetical protein